MSRTLPVPPRDPWLPARPSKAVHYALTNLAAGNASAGQQTLALDWILNHAARTYDLTFRPGGQDGERASSFAAGMQHVGQQIVRAMKLDPNTLEGEAHE